MCKEEMMEDLEEFYEAAGFVDIHDKVLKEMNEEEIEQLHSNAYRQADIEEEN